MQFGSIWSTISSLLQSNPFDKILEKPGIKFEELINEDQIISEFKNCNPKLMKHFTMKNFEKLINYITQEPEEDQDNTKAKKFPFVSCELLTADVTQVYDAFFNYNNDEASDQQDDPQEDSNLDDIDNPHENQQEDEDQEKNNSNSKTTAPERRQSPQKTGRASPSKNDTTEALKQRTQHNQESQQQEEDVQPAEVDDSHVEDDEEDDQRPPQRNSIGRGSLGKTNNYFQMTNTSADASTDERIANLDQNNLKIVTHKAKKQPKSKTYLLDVLFNFVNQPAQEGVNLTLAGYFSKVVIQLYNKRENELLDYIYNDDKILINLVEQFHSQSISNVTSRLLCYKIKNYDHNLERRMITLDKIFEKLNNFESDLDLDIEVLQNCCSVYQEIIKFVNDINSGSQLLQHIIRQYSEDFVNSIKNSESQTVIQHKLDIVQSILQYFHQSQNNAEEAASDIDSTPLLSLIEEHTKDYLDYLQKDFQDQAYVAQDGHTVIPFSQSKMRILEILYLCIKLQHQGVILQLNLNQFFKILFDLIEKHESNNFLHSCVQRIIIASLEMDSHGIRRSLLEECQFIGFLNSITAKTVSDRSSKKFPTAFNKGFLGQITEIGKKFREIAENNSELQSYLSDESWISFEKTFLSAQLSKHEFQLGGHSSKPNESQNSVSYDQNQLHQIYQKFLSSGRKPTEQSPAKPKDEEEDDDQEPEQEEEIDLEQGKEAGYDDEEKEPEEEKDQDKDQNQDDSQEQKNNAADPFAEFENTSSNAVQITNENFEWEPKKDDLECEIQKDYLKDHIESQEGEKQPAGEVESQQVSENQSQEQVQDQEQPSQAEPQVGEESQPLKQDEDNTNPDVEESKEQQEQNQQEPIESQIQESQQQGEQVEESKNSEEPQQAQESTE